MLETIGIEVNDWFTLVIWLFAWYGSFVACVLFVIRFLSDAIDD